MTDAVSLQRAGIYNTTGRIVQTHIQSTLGSAGQRTCLGFIAPNGATYIHIKTNLGGSSNQMHKFEYDGYTYSSINCHNSVTFYTYHGTSSPYDPSLVNWGETPGGILREQNWVQAPRSFVRRPHSGVRPDDERDAAAAESRISPAPGAPRRSSTRSRRQGER